MFIIKKKNIIIIMLIIAILLIFFLIRDVPNNETLEIASLPVSNKVIVLDAGHGVPDEGAESSNRNY